LGVTTESMQLFFGQLALVAIAGSLGLIVLRLLAAGGNDGAARLGRSISEAGTWLAFVVAVTATAGSLYFSEVAHFAPCRLCWFQRIAMYPLSVILLVGALRRDAGVRWYAVPIAAIGALIAAYHTLIEWRPSLDSGACELTGPSCTYVWFREFGFLSLATMALVGFLTILTLLLVRFPARLGGGDVADLTAPSANRSEPVA
jgi:disulfide bond formation protein DsbB